MHKTSINDLDTCAEECMKDSKCFGFDFGKKDRKNKCLHSTRNTQRYTYNENYDSWLKVCYYDSGNPGKTEFDLMLPCCPINRAEKNINRKIKKFVFDRRTVYTVKRLRVFPHNKDVFAVLIRISVEIRFGLQFLTTQNLCNLYPCRYVM